MVDVRSRGPGGRLLKLLLVELAGLQTTYATLAPHELEEMIRRTGR